MLMGNCDHEKTVVISPTTNEWSQNQLNEKSILMAPTTTTTNLMEKPSHVQDLSHSQNHQNQPPLKCPRCDSSNTKFCYYNNYSLSQPRHFCKACKRYWTRGGTLRNVPVGGGCRKNKRVKRAASSASGCVEASSSSANIINHNNTQPQVEVSSALNHINNLFYGLPTNPSEMNLTFPSRISGGFQHHHDILQPQMNSLGLGFSSSSPSSTLMSISTTTTSPDRPHNLVNGFSSSNSLLSSYNSIFGSTSATARASPTMATLLASNFHQQKFQNGGATRGINQFQGLAPLEELQQQMNNGNGVSMKEVKVEGGVGENRLEWSMNSQTDQIGGFTSDPSSLYWSTTSNTSVGSWHDPTNIGSSLTSLI